MKTLVYCETIDKGVQEFYLVCGRVRYPICKQLYRKSNRDFFKGGVYIDDLSNYSKAHSNSVRKVLDKLPLALQYIEKEHGICVYTKKKDKKEQYKRSKFDWQSMEVA